MVNFALQGDKDLISEVDRRIAALDEGSRKLIRDYSVYVPDLTFQLSPVDTGFMREHAKSELFGDTVATQGGPTGFVLQGRGVIGFESGWYAEDFESEGLAFYPVFQEFGTVFMQAQPSLGPAWNVLEPTFIRDAEQLLETTIVRG